MTWSLNLSLSGATSSTDDDELKNIAADKWRWIDNNIILEGNVNLTSKNLNIKAPKVVINTDTHGFETFGATDLVTRKHETTNLTPAQLATLKTTPDVLVELKGLTFDSFGNPKIVCDVYYLSDKMKASKVLGNLKTGYLTFDNARCIAGSFAFNADKGTRFADGNMKLEGAELSTCEYLHEDKSHYSITADEINLYSHQNNGYDVKNYDFNIGQHSIKANNAKVNVYGVPLLWFPTFYKPKDESPGLFDFNVGYTSKWGAFVSLYKTIQVTDYPYSSVSLLADYYSKRGFGYGTDINVRTENSKTELFMYGIYDTDPYQSDAVKISRYNLPNWRYDVRLTNVTHITPRLDFRAHVEFLSDPFFQDQFFNTYYKNDPEPASYVALEQQFDYLTMALYAKFQTNSFFTTVQRLPEFRIDVPRMKIFDTDLYYQGSHSINYSTMNWRKYDYPRVVPNFVDPSNYSTMRLDTVNFLYLPFKLDWLNIVPRAGVRMTYYSNTSKTKVTPVDLQNIFVADTLIGMFPSDVKNYTSGGGGQVRFIGEFGVEANTKIHRTFSNFKNDFLGIDGLRHIMEPYVNYTYVTKPTLNRDYIYYFDDIDRIDKQNFFRLGLKNRLQTRSNNRMINTFEMENYWTLFIEEQQGFHRIGDFATKITTSPIKGLVFSTLFSLNAGGNNQYGRGPSIRNGKEIERQGISGNWLNRWNFSVTYEPIEDFIFTLGYYYNDTYATQSAYSMGSTLTDLISNSAFDKFYGVRNQIIRAGIGVPLTRDRKTKLAYQIRYDFENGFISNQRVGLIHQLHCWEFTFFVAQDTNWNGIDSKKKDYSVAFSAKLNGVPNPIKEAKGEMPALFRLGDATRSGNF